MKYLFLTATVVLSLFFTACSDDSKTACSGQDCSGLGVCVEDDVTGEAACDCNTGYEPAGLTCVEHFSVQDEVVVDNIQALMFTNPAIDHLERPAAIAACEAATTAGYDDWYLPDSETQGTFHFQMHLAGLVPGQLFDYCLAEVTTDGYVRTKKGAEDYGSVPGAEIGFTGAANVRCVRNLP